jgi:UDP:flavonoid glycosyltransferase YjiC (YdhE family)
MGSKRVLFVSGSIGLGHVTRDLAIAAALRRLRPSVTVAWMAGSPAREWLREAGEWVLPEADAQGNLSQVAERAAGDGPMNLASYVWLAADDFERNVRAFRQAVTHTDFDLWIGDETYELATALANWRIRKRAPFVMIYDFVGLDAVGHSLTERLRVFGSNLLWAVWMDRAVDLALLIGELEDIPERRMGPLLPGRRALARRRYHPVGYVLPFDPRDLADRAALRARLGYGPEPLVVCAAGGTSVGADLLTLCAQAVPLLRRQRPDLQVHIVAGPRIPARAIPSPPGVTVTGYVPRLYEHFAAADLAVVQGGGTTTLELTALRVPFLYAPLEGHCEQEEVARRVARHGAGVRLHMATLTPELLAAHILAHLGEGVTYPPIPLDGAERAAQLIAGLL